MQNPLHKSSRPSRDRFSEKGLFSRVHQWRTTVRGDGYSDDDGDRLSKKPVMVSVAFAGSQVAKISF